MAFFCSYKGKEYELPESMRKFCKYQVDRISDNLELSHLEFIEVSTKDNSTTYSVFVGVVDTIHYSKIIIYGEYDNSYKCCPFKYGSFNYIEVPNSEMIDFECFSDSDILLNTCKNLCVIVLKSEVIFFNITPDFLENIDHPLFDVEGVWFDDEDDNTFLSVERIKYSREITYLPIHCCHSFDKSITSSVKKTDDRCNINIGLCFTCVCRDSSTEEIHSETMNEITIDFTNEQIRITYDMKTTAYVHYVSGGEYNDEPTMSTDERHHVFKHETKIVLFPEEDEEDD